MLFHNRPVRYYYHPYSFPQNRFFPQAAPVSCHNSHDPILRGHLCLSIGKSSKFITQVALRMDLSKNFSTNIFEGEHILLLNYISTGLSVAGSRELGHLETTGQICKNPDAVKISIKITCLGWWWCGGKTSSRCKRKCLASRSYAASLCSKQEHPVKIF